jgi:hypothetical protein
MPKLKNQNVITEADDNQINQGGKFIGIVHKLSRSAKKFFNLFLWRMIYLASQKNIRNISEENALENLVLELQKPKLREILAKGRKIFIHIPDGKDVYVKIVNNLKSIFSRVFIFILNLCFIK